MRVVSGTARGSKLKSVPGDTTRPILDRVKTALFDILRPTLADQKVLDMFAGSGSIGIEALSQGAAHCTFLDLAPAAVETIQSNLRTTHFESKALVRKADAFAFLKRSLDIFDLIFIAPPQYKNLWLQAVQMLAERPEMVSPNGLIVVQIDPKEYEPLQLTHFKETMQRKYGNTLLVFLEKTQE